MGKSVNPAWVSGHYKLIDRSTDTSVASWVFKAQDTAWVQTVQATAVGVVFGWGESANQTTSTSSGTITLQFAINGGAFTTVGAATAVKYANSAAVTDAGTYTSAYTTAPTGVASWGGTGEYDENNSAAARTPVDQYFEALFVLTLDSAQLTNGDVLTFQILHGGSTFTSTDATPSLTVSLPATHATTGTIAGGSGTVAGTASNFTPHANTGALAGGSATVAGTAARSAATVEHATTGTLAAGSATVAGTASNFTPHATTGTLSAGNAVVSGTASNFTSHTTSGTLSGGNSTVAGTASSATTRSSSGAIGGGSSVVTGTAQRSGAPVSHDTSGTLAGGSATVSGTATRGVKQEGAGGSRKRKRTYIERDGKVLLFDKPEDAAAFVAAEKALERPQTVKKVRTRQAPIQIDLSRWEGITAVLKAPIEQVINTDEFERWLREYEIELEDEEILLLI